MMVHRFLLDESILMVTEIRSELMYNWFEKSNKTSAEQRWDELKRKVCFVTPIVSSSYYLGGKSNQSREILTEGTPIAMLYLRNPSLVHISKTRCECV